MAYWRLCGLMVLINNGLQKSGWYGREIEPHPTVAKLCRYGKLVRAQNKAAAGKSSPNGAADNRY